MDLFKQQPVDGAGLSTSYMHMMGTRQAAWAQVARGGPQFGVGNAGALPGTSRQMPRAKALRLCRRKAAQMRQPASKPLSEQERALELQKLHRMTRVLNQTQAVQAQASNTLGYASKEASWSPGQPGLPIQHVKGYRYPAHQHTASHHNLQLSSKPLPRRIGPRTAQLFVQIGLDVPQQLDARQLQHTQLRAFQHENELVYGLHPLVEHMSGDDQAAHIDVPAGDDAYGWCVERQPASAAAYRSEAPSAAHAYRGHTEPAGLQAVPVGGRTTNHRTGFQPHLSVEWQPHDYDYHAGYNAVLGPASYAQELYHGTPPGAACIHVPTPGQQRGASTYPVKRGSWPALYTEAPGASAEEQHVQPVAHSTRAGPKPQRYPVIVGQAVHPRSMSLDQGAEYNPVTTRAQRHMVINPADHSRVVMAEPPTHVSNDRDMMIAQGNQAQHDLLRPAPQHQRISSGAYSATVQVGLLPAEMGVYPAEGVVDSAVPTAHRQTPAHHTRKEAVMLHTSPSIPAAGPQSSAHQLSGLAPHPQTRGGAPVSMHGSSLARSAAGGAAEASTGQARMHHTDEVPGVVSYTAAHHTDGCSSGGKRARSVSMETWQQEPKLSACPTTPDSLADQPQASKRLRQGHLDVPDMMCEKGSDGSSSEAVDGSGDGPGQRMHTRGAVLSCAQSSTSPHPPPANCNDTQPTPQAMTSASLSAAQTRRGLPPAPPACATHQQAEHSTPDTPFRQQAATPLQPVQFTQAEPSPQAGSLPHNQLLPLLSLPALSQQGPTVTSDAAAGSSPQPQPPKPQNKVAMGMLEQLVTLANKLPASAINSLPAPVLHLMMAALAVPAANQPASTYVTGTAPSNTASALHSQPNLQTRPSVHTATSGRSASGMPLTQLLQERAVRQSRSELCSTLPLTSAPIASANGTTGDEAASCALPAANGDRQGQEQEQPNVAAQPQPCTSSSSFLLEVLFQPSDDGLTREGEDKPGLVTDMATIQQITIPRDFLIFWRSTGQLQQRAPGFMLRVLAPGCWEALLSAQSSSEAQQADLQVWYECGRVQSVRQEPVQGASPSVLLLVRFSASGERWVRLEEVSNEVPSQAEVQRWLELGGKLTGVEVKQLYAHLPRANQTC